MKLFLCSHFSSVGSLIKEEMHWLPIKELDKYKAFPPVKYITTASSKTDCIVE